MKMPTINDIALHIREASADFLNSAWEMKRIIKVSVVITNTSPIRIKNSLVVIKNGKRNHKYGSVENEQIMPEKRILESGRFRFFNLNIFLKTMKRIAVSIKIVTKSENRN